MLVTELFKRSVATRPRQQAIVDESTVLTWAQLGNEVARARTWLSLEGLEPGDRLVYCAAPDHRMVVLMWACLLSGVVFVPLHEDLTGEQVQYVATDCEARLVIATPFIAAQLALPIYQQVSDDVDRWSRFQPGEDTASPAVAGDHALLIYTSGTTGKPKGVACRHQQVAAATDAIGTCLDYKPDDVILCRLPLSFDYGLYQLLLAARVGASVVLCNRSHDMQLLGDLVEHHVTVVPLVPSIAQMLTVLQRRHPTATQVRLFTNTGARLSPPVMAELLRHFPTAEYASMYGMTECKRISILPPGEYEAYPDSVGYPIPGDQVVIVDPDGVEVEAGIAGEIVVRGATVMDGYWGVPMDRQTRFRNGPAGLELHTGDQGWVDNDGRLYFVGRNDDIIKRRGIRISLHEIEDVAEQATGVDSAIALKPTVEDGPLELVFTGTSDPTALQSHLAEHLDHARRPNRITHLPALPLTDNGKPDRKALQQARAVTTTHPTTV